MAERPVRIITKRTAVPGKIPTGTTGTELNLIKTGELASNLADKKLFSYDGSNVFEFGTNSFLGLTGGTITGDLNVTGTISATTLGSSGDCVENIYVSNIHSCSPLNINPLDEGNVYFGSTSAVTFDLLNKRVGIGTTTPQQPFHISSSDSARIRLQNTSTNIWDLWANNGSLGLQNDFVIQHVGTRGAIYFGTYSTENVTYTRSNGSLVVSSSGNSAFIGSGNVGIGLTGTTAKLHINNTGTTDSFLVEDSTNPDLTPFVIDNAGNVGIGTTAYTSTVKLNISGSTNLNNSYLFWAYDGVNNNDYIISNDSQHGGSNNPLGFYLFKHDSSLSPTSGTGVSTLDAGSIWLNRATDVNYIAGNLGVGTTAPSEKLDVSGKTKTISLQVTSGATSGYVLTSDASGNASWQNLSSLSGNYLPISGGTVTGATTFTNGLTSNTISATSIYTDYVNFNTGVTAISQVGRLMWNDADEVGGIEVMMKGGNTTLQIGEENLARVYNSDVVTLTSGMVVYVDGSQGNTISVKRASATGETASSRTLGVVTETIPIGDRGFVNTFGLVRDLDTSAYSGGTHLWLGTTPGTYTSIPPEAPNHIVSLGFVSRVSATIGSVFIHISNGWELDELHDVTTSNVTTGDLLSYSGNVWTNTKTLNGSYTITGDTYVGGSLTATTISGDTIYGNRVIANNNVSIGYSGATSDLFNVFSTTGVKSLTILSNGSIYNPNSNTTNSNTNFGYNANIVNLTGTQISSFGYEALLNNLASNNTAVGYRTLYQNTTGDSNTAIGLYALRDNTVGQNNTAIGVNSLIVNTTGSSNTAIGVNSLRFKVTGDDNVAIGVNSLYLNVTGSTNTAIGVGSQQNSLVVDNTSLGYRSLYLNTVGLQNTAIGTSAARSNTTGSYNTGVGYGSLQLNTTGNYNVGLGRYAGYGNTTGIGNIAIGPNSMFASSSGSSNTAIGYQSMFSNVSGSNNVNIGYETAYSLTGGSSNVNVGYRSGYRNLTGATTVAVGQEALYNSLVGSNVGVGYRSLYTNTIGSNNTALGDSSLLLNTTGSNNIGIGYLGNYGNTTGSGNIGIGPSALSTSYTGSANTAIGFESMRFLSSASNNTSVGYQALRTVSSGGDNSAFGRYAGYSTTTGIRNVFNGTDAFFTNTTGSNNIGIGYRAGFSSLSGGNNVVIGHESMYFSTGVSSTVAVGYRSLYLNTTGALNTSIGTESLNKNTIGSNNVSFGYRSLYENLSGNSNTSVGYGSSLSNNSGAFNTAVGNTAFYFNTTGSYNTTLGNESMYNNTTGLANIAIGSNALFNNTTGSYNTAVGYNTALGITSGSNNTIIGSRVSGLSGLSDSLILADGAGVIKLSADSAHHLFIPNSPSSGSTSDRILTRSSSGEVKEVDTTTVVLKTKSGVVAYTSFTGSPYSYDVVFTSAFSDALYSPQIIGYDARSWSISDVSASGFRIETNSTTLLTNNVYWTATKHGEN